jgi:hypothetical protein
MDLQYFPTPKNLARKAWAKFKEKDIVRLLEPSAGEGHLLYPLTADESYKHHNQRRTPVDVIEFDLTRHPILKSKGFNVVGVDFLSFTGSGSYSHILANPPFSEGVKHALKAWDLLFDGELVIILSAESIRNPYSAERKLLVNLIEQHGSVEFLQEEFLVPDAERKTRVEIALVHLEKDSNFEMDFLAGLKVDDMNSAGPSSGFKEFNDVAIHQGMIDNTVVAFNAAVKAAREMVFATARSRYYKGLLGSTMASFKETGGVNAKAEVKANLDTVRKELQEVYEDLRDRAWTQMLHSTQVKSRLSSKAARRLEAEFENVKQLEFTAANIYGFIVGLINKSAEINIQMLCDVFDSITKYHSENRIYFKGWKSNDKHRSAAFKVKNTRFILPGSSGSYSPDYETRSLLRDFDMVFAQLDGKSAPDVSLEYIFTQHFEELKRGERVSSSYFSLRIYPGASTLHFFPTNKKLIDRFNRAVGKHRKWLPEEHETVPEAFWLQYDKAEIFAAEFQSEISKKNKSRSWWNSIESDISSNDTERAQIAMAALDEAIDTVLLSHGINLSNMIEAQPARLQLPLLAA